MQIVERHYRKVKENQVAKAVALMNRGPNAEWADWYPRGVVPDMLAPLEQSVYGAPNIETLHTFAALVPQGGRIGDIGGGEARYALPLTRMGFNVIDTDVDEGHLIRARNKARLPGLRGRLETRRVNVTGGLQIEKESLDGILNAGFAYLMPPDDFKDHFTQMTEALKPGGAMVLEFATERDRRPSKTSTQSLIGDNEYNYGHKEGLELLREEFRRHGYRDVVFQEKTIDLEEPYYLHNKLIIASGIK